jgi:hypothetical protein
MIFDLAPLLLPFLAQSDGSSSDFQSQLIRILAVMCAIFFLFIADLYLIYHRSTERRRREREGLEPLPDLHVSLYEWFQRVTGTGQPPTAAPRAASPAAAMPDLGMLTGDLPEPDLPDFPIEAAQPAAPRELAGPAAQADDWFQLPDMGNVAEHIIVAEPGSPVAQPVSMEDSDEMPAPPDSIELLRVWRDVSDGSLIIEIAGQRFTSLADLRAANLDRRLMNVVRDLTTMLRAMPPAPPTAAPPSPLPAPPQAAAPNDKPAPPDDEGMPSLAPGALFKQMGRVARGYRPESVEETPMLSIPDQIEALLQKRLVDHPEFAEREIHVRPSPHGGVRIEVDGEFFDGVGEVADDQVRALIQDVVREWEKTTGR